MTHEEPATGDVVQRAVQFEEKRGAGFDCAEDRGTAGAPEIHLVQRLLGKETVPLIIGYTDVVSHPTRGLEPSSNKTFRRSQGSTLYFRELPFALSTGYFFAFVSNLRLIAFSRSMSRS